MRKISTLFEKDPNDLGLVINKYKEENLWVLDGGIPTRKWDGTACMVLDNKLYKRYDAKKGKKAPEGSIPCQEADVITGHHPHWVLCSENEPLDKYHMEAFNAQKYDLEDGTYELCGEKINKNREKIVGHELIPHGVIHYHQNLWL